MKRWTFGFIACVILTVAITAGLASGCALRQRNQTTPAPESEPFVQPIPRSALAPEQTNISNAAVGEASPQNMPAAPQPPTPEPTTLEKIQAAHPLPVRDLFHMAQQLGHVGGGTRRMINAEPPEYQVGDQATFWIAEEAGKSYREITATLQHIGEHAVWWVENGIRLDRDGLALAAQRFDTQTYPTNRRFFGEEWFPGIDNDPRIHIVNAQLSSGIGGYYSSADEYPNAINPHSNQREMIYINLKAYTPGDPHYDAVIAHEFQHMIHWNNDPNESTWVDEGLSELAVFLNGYGRERWITVFSRQPDTQLNAWTDVPGTAGVHYGASYLFMRYFADRFGADYVRALVATDESDILGFDRALAGTHLTFNEVFQDWVVANYLNDRSVGDGIYGYRDTRVSVIIEQVLKARESWGDLVHQYATDYLELRPEQAPLTVHFKGATTVPVLPTKPHSGQYFFWSNRGDGSATSLTRAFDLSDTERATLTVWLWYDIEEFFDFAHLEVSVDGGESWELLAGQYSTTENPTGNSLGPGYSGRSLINQKHDWVQETIDLSPYAGHQILLRWQYITDDAYNAPGLAIDDLSIPEIGYFEDFEKGEEGWVTSGFVRINNILPEHWVLQVIERGESANVQRIPVEEGQATFVVEKPVVLAISAMTPFTTEPGSYTISTD